ncbi:hypothetical protein EON83_17735 [bacterium]|nr:MAG: hypothetical protein EON83_17735 [bacterium]
MNKSFGTLMLGGALAVSSQLVAIKPANAALLASYNFNGSTSINSAPISSQYSVTRFLPSTVPGSNMSSQAFSAQTNTGTGRSRYITFGNLTSVNKADAIAKGTYNSFTLTPHATGQGLKFSSLSFTTDVGASASASNVGGFFLRVNAAPGGGFIDYGSVIEQNSTTAPRVGNTFPTTLHTINLSGLTAPGTGVFTYPVTFQLYMYDNTGNGITPVTGSTGGIHIDDVQLNGQIAPVPELSTGMLVALAMGALAIVGLRRKKGAGAPMNMAF